MNSPYTYPAGRVTPGLGGTGLLADDLYLMAHDEVTGRPFLRSRAVGLGLAGGLLAELLLASAITTWQGRVLAIGPGPRGDQLGHQISGLVASEHELRPIPDWLAFLARTAAGDVDYRGHVHAPAHSVGSGDRTRPGSRSGRLWGDRQQPASGDPG